MSLAPTSEQPQQRLLTGTTTLREIRYRTDSAQLGRLGHAPVIQRTAFQYVRWDGTDRIHAKDAPGDRNMMPDDLNRLECFAEQFAIAAFLVFVSSAAASLFVLVTIFTGGI
jgi:hypothetical protein